MNLKKIEDFNYFVSDTGRVYNSKGKEIKRQKNHDGYYTVNLWDGSKYHHKRVNRLVAIAFIDNPNNLPVVNHIDHNRGNDNLSNLEWVSYSENKEKSIEHDPTMGKTKSHINEGMAHEICRLIQEGFRNKEIEEILEIPRTSILDIRRGKSWVEVSKQYRMVGSTRGISEETVRWVCQKLVKGLTVSEIVSMGTSKYITKSVVSKIKNKKTFINISKEYF